MQLDGIDSKEVSGITFYTKEDGRIITSFSGNLEIFDLSAFAAYDYLLCSSNPLTQYVENGSLVSMPDKPNADSIFNYSMKQWDNPSVERGWEVIKIKRNVELSRSDWTQFEDVPLTNKAEWSTYRQALRDITKQSDPFNVVWPTKPQE